MQEPGASADHAKATVVHLSQEASPKAGPHGIRYSLTALQLSLQVNFVLVQGFFVVATPLDFKKQCTNYTSKTITRKEFRRSKSGFT